MKGINNTLSTPQLIISKRKKHSPHLHTSEIFYILETVNKLFQIVRLSELVVPGGFDEKVTKHGLKVIR